MEKVTVTMTMIYENEQEMTLSGKYEKDKLWIEEVENQTEMVLDFKNQTLTRITKEYKLMIPFKEKEETTLEIEFLEEKENIQLSVQTDIYKYQDRHLTVRYTIMESGETIEYRIKF